MAADARLYQTLNAALGFAGLAGLGSLQIVKAAAGMAVQGEEPGFLALQGIEAVKQREVLGDIREISGMVDVLVVHRGRHCACIDDKLGKFRTFSGA